MPNNCFNLQFCIFVYFGPIMWQALLRFILQFVTPFSIIFRVVFKVSLFFLSSSVLYLLLITRRRRQIAFSFYKLTMAYEHSSTTFLDAASITNLRYRFPFHHQPPPLLRSHLSKILFISYIITFSNCNPYYRLSFSNPIFLSVLFQKYAFSLLRKNPLRAPIYLHSISSINWRMGFIRLHPFQISCSLYIFQSGISCCQYLLWMNLLLSTCMPQTT